MKQEIINALSDYEGTDFFVNDALIKFIEDTPAASPVPENKKSVHEIASEKGDDLAFYAELKKGIPISEGDKGEGFTRGDWYVSDIPQKDGFYVYTELNKFEAIARIYKENAHSKQAEANARLIAAAPDMYNALKDIVMSDKLGMGKSAKQLRLDIAEDILNRINNK